MTGTLATTEAAARRAMQALVPRRRWTPSQWAENCRVLGEQEAKRTGRYTFDKTPYWREVIDAAARPGVEEVVCIKGHQVGWSETCRNLFGFWVDLEPGPILVLMPDENASDAFRAERIEPLIRNTPAVGQHVSGRKRDTTKHRIRFDTCSAFFTWSGSGSGTKSRPIRRLICEEPDDYVEFSGRGGDPLAKAEKRLTTYRDTGHSTVLIGGTPTSKLGPIWKRWEGCAKHARYHYWVPCPHCRGYQMLVWGNGGDGPGVKWPKLADMDRAQQAEAVKVGGLAHYECRYCKGAIHDDHKPAMLLAGKWASEEQRVAFDGTIDRPAAEARRVGFKLSTLYSPWKTFSDLAGDFLLVMSDPQGLADFVNQELAETFEEKAAKIEPSAIRDRAAISPPPMVVPRWCRWLIATADTQGNDERSGYFWYTIRAWGCEYRSQLVDFGVCHSKAELVQRCLERSIPIDGGGAVVPSRLFIDSGGNRTLEVYQLAQTDERITPTKGRSRPSPLMVEESPRKAYGIVLWLIDPWQAKDLLYRLINDPDPTRYLVNSAVNADYCSQMAAEVKEIDPKTGKPDWVAISEENHAWDCEAIQAAAAARMGAWEVEPPPEPTGESDDPGQQQQPAGWATGHRGRY